MKRKKSQVRNRWFPPKVTFSALSASAGHCCNCEKSPHSTIIVIIISISRNIVMSSRKFEEKKTFYILIIVTTIQYPIIHTYVHDYDYHYHLHIIITVKNCENQPPQCCHIQGSLLLLSSLSLSSSSSLLLLSSTEALLQFWKESSLN